VAQLKQSDGRLSQAALNASGYWLYGPRFASQLARAIGIKDARAVRYWSSGERQCTKRYSLMIVQLVNLRRGQRVQIEAVRFNDYVAKLPIELQPVALSLTGWSFEKRVPEST
jgi:hypothetical protein